jgi:hypothetical protein
LNLTQLNGPTAANIGVLYPKPRRTYDFATLASILASVGTSMWSVPTLTGANAANQIAYFAAGGTVSDLGLRPDGVWNGGGIVYGWDGCVGGGYVDVGGNLDVVDGGTTRVAPGEPWHHRAAYGYHRIALGNAASCAITLPTNADMTQAQVMTL